MGSDRRECVVCGSQELGEHYASLTRCEGCGFVFYEPELSLEELEGLYDEAYFTGEEYADYPSDRRAFERNFELFLAKMWPYTRGQIRPRLLEVGCAYGFFLNLARRQYEAHGLDIGEAGPRYARERFGLDARSSSLDDYRSPAAPFDVVCLWDTIEHLPDLRGAFERIAELTRPGSLLFLTTNDIDSLNARLRRGRWRQIHPPTHLWYFSRKTIARFLDRYGFEVLEVSAVGYHRSLGNMVHNVLGGRFPVLRGAIDGAGLGRLTIPIDLGDIFWLAAGRRAG